MELNELNPFIRYAGLSHAGEHFRLWRHCYDCRLFFCVGGRGALQEEDAEFPLCEGDAVFLPPLSRYRFSFEASDPLVMYVFNFDLCGDFSELRESLSTPDDAHFDPARSPVYTLPQVFSAPLYARNCDMLEPLRAIHLDFIRESPYCREASSARLKLCLVQLLASAPKRGKPDALAAAVVEMIHRDYASQELSNETIAAEAGYHPYYLNQVFRRQQGMPIHHFLLNYRLQQACIFLRETEDPISDVAWKCGFSSASHFVRCFKKRYGVTPLKYRTANWESL